MYTINLGHGGRDEIHLNISAREALHLAQRILNQLDLKAQDDVVMIISGDVQTVAA